MFEYFYNEILRRTIIGFGTLFNNLTIKATNASDSVVSVTKVPLAYGPTQKFLARLEQQADLNRSTAMTLPRMSFEFTGLTYDPSRKVTTTQTFVVKDPNTGEETKKGFAYFVTWAQFWGTPFLGGEHGRPEKKNKKRLWVFSGP